MKHKGVLIAGLVMLLAASVHAQVTIPDPLPAFEFSFSPANPTAQDTVDLRVEGLWPNSCVPNDTNVFIDGNNIEIRLLLPGAIDCNEPNCLPVLSAFGINVGVGPLPTDVYTVTVRVVSCREATEAQGVGTFTVGIPAGGPDGEPNLPVVGPGTCVVLLQDTPNGGGTMLRAGQAGVIVCCENEDCASGRVLVSWFFRTGGTGTTDDCFDDTPRLFAPASTMWVNLETVPLGVCFDRCGILQRTSQGCLVFETDDEETYNLFGTWLENSIGPGEEFDLGDRVRVQGLISIVRPSGTIFTCREETGDIYSPMLSPCAPAGGGGGCCDAGFEPGDRVRLLVSNPPDLSGRPAFGLPAGTLGTVLCCNSDNEDFTVYVSWDNFQGGFNMSFLCDTTPPSHTASSAWWVDCDDIVLLAGGGNGNGNGNGNGQICPLDNLTIGFGNNGIRLFRDPACPATPRTFSDCVTVTVTSNFRARLSLSITPMAGVNGTWQGTITPNIVPAGQSNVVVCITADGVNLTGIPAGQDVQVAKVSILAVPEPAP